MPKRPVATKRTPHSRAKASAPRVEVAPRILSADEKRSLILAHAAMRRPVDPVQRMSVWAGVMLCLAFIVGGWFYTVGTGIKNSMAGTRDAEMQRAVQQVQQFGQGSDTLSGQLQHVSQQLDSMAAQQAIMNAMAASSTAVTSTGRGDIFKAKLAAPTSTLPDSTR